MRILCPDNFFHATFSFFSTSAQKMLFLLIKKFYSEDRRLRIDDEKQLISELYNIKNFDWGGLHQNSLE